MSVGFVNKVSGYDCLNELANFNLAYYVIVYCQALNLLLDWCRFFCIMGGSRWRMSHLRDICRDELFGDSWPALVSSMNPLIKWFASLVLICSTCVLIIHLLLVVRFLVFFENSLNTSACGFVQVLQVFLLSLICKFLLDEILLTDGFDLQLF